MCLLGSFVCEYVGDVLTDPDSDRRSLYYVSQGTHPTFQFGGITNIDGERYSIDPLWCGSVARMINHSCEANLKVSRNESADSLTNSGNISTCEIDPVSVTSIATI